MIYVINEHRGFEMETLIFLSTEQEVYFARAVFPHSYFRNEPGLQFHFQFLDVSPFLPFL